MTTTYPEYENILVEQSEEPEGLIKVTLNRPQALNALSADLLDDFFNFLDIFENDPYAFWGQDAFRGPDGTRLTVEIPCSEGYEPRNNPLNWAQMICMSKK